MQANKVFPTLTKFWKTLFIFLTIIWNEIYPSYISTGTDLIQQSNQQHGLKFLRFKNWGSLLACNISLSKAKWKVLNVAAPFQDGTGGLSILILQVLFCNIVHVFATRNCLRNWTAVCGSFPHHLRKRWGGGDGCGTSCGTGLGARQVPLKDGQGTKCLLQLLLRARD